MIHPDDQPEPRTAEILRGIRRDIYPSRDLWPGIEERLRRRRPPVAGRAWGIGLAIAATVLVMFATSGPGPQGPRPDAESTEIQLVLDATTGPRSATAHSLAKHLTILDRAIGESEAALRETPGDLALLDLLQSLQRRRLALLAQAARYAAES